MVVEPAWVVVMRRPVKEWTCHGGNPTERARLMDEWRLLAEWDESIAANGSFRPDWRQSAARRAAVYREYIAEEMNNPTRGQ